MLFHVFFDPQEIKEANRFGPIGLGVLVGILRDFYQNCTLVEIDNWMIRHQIKEEVEALPESPERSRIKKLFELLKKSNRFVDCIDGYPFPNESPAEIAFRSVDKVGLDFLLTRKPPHDGFESNVEHSGIEGYATTEFSQIRYQAFDGFSVPEGIYGCDEFFPRFFGGLLRHTKTIHICDRIVGQKADDHFLYSLNRFLHFVEARNKAPEGLVITIHTEAGREEFLLQKLRSYCKSCTISVKVHGINSPLPHDRYLVTDHVAVDIGRGLDFLDQATEKNRDTRFRVCPRSSITKLFK